ncbi:GNAT family N-acetyltransferase [Acaryochloris marina]|nr:GNAT family N-acetyltransferase [Acaryochloris marina]
MIFDLPSPFQMRPAVGGDVEALFSIHRSAMHEYVDRIWGWDDDWQQNQFFKDFNLLNHCLAICKVDEPVGFVCFQSGPDAILIRTIELAKDYQGRGIANALFEQLIDVSEDSGKSIQLQVFKINDRARCLYERLGFVVIGQTEYHYQMEFRA